MSALVELKDVTKVIGGLTILNHLSLSLKQGEALGVLGPNGAGKTTMLNLIAGDMTPTSGCSWRLRVCVACSKTACASTSSRFAGDCRKTGRARHRIPNALSTLADDLMSRLARLPGSDTAGGAGAPPSCGACRKRVTPWRCA